MVKGERRRGSGVREKCEGPMKRWHVERKRNEDLGFGFHGIIDLDGTLM